MCGWFLCRAKRLRWAPQMEIGDGPGSSTKQMERQRSQGDVSISSCQSIVICIVLGNVFLESFQAHIEDDNNIRAVKGSKLFFFYF